MKIVAMVLALALTTAATPADSRQQPDPARWPHATGTWSSSMIAAAPDIFGIPNWSGGFDHQSVRQVVRVSKGGAAVRIRVSNVFGTAPLRLTGATIGRAGDGAAVQPGTLRPVTFDRRTSTVVPAGREIASDPVPLRVGALDRLTVTFYFAQPTGPATFHLFALATTYRAAGDHRTDAGAAAFGETSQSFYYLSGVDTVGDRRPGPAGGSGTVVAFGDSITDGSFSTPDTDNRYPDELAERLVAAGRPTGVLNAGIGGNQILTGGDGFGEPGVARFARDALDRPGVRTVIILEGINDIGMGESAGRPVTAQQLIDGQQAMIRAARARHVKVVGATITPTKGCTYPGYDTARGEAVRDAVNEWIRTSGAFDAVADFDRALADPADPDAMRAQFNGGDWLHPNDAGMRAMAAAVPVRAL
jgi:lysophospholipase L1-like esterase